MSVTDDRKKLSALCVVFSFSKMSATATTLCLECCRRHLYMNLVEVKAIIIILVTIKSQVKFRQYYCTYIVLLSIKCHWGGCQLRPSLETGDRYLLVAK